MDECFHKLIVESSPNGCAYCRLFFDGKGRALDFAFIELNSALASMAGQSREEMVGKKASQVLPGIFEESYDWLAAFEETAASGGSSSLRSYFKPFQSWYNISIFSDRLHHFGLVFTDISAEVEERRKREEVLTDMTERYRLITNLTGDIISQVDRENRWTFLNDNACAFWGGSREELLGRKFTDYIHPEDVAGALRVIDRMAETGRPIKRGYNRNKTPDGWRTVEWNAEPFFKDGHYIGYQCTGRDITEKRESERILREKEAELRESQEIARLGRWDYFHEEGRLHWSDMVYKIFEKDPATFDVSYSHFLDIIHPEDREPLHQAWETSLATQEPYINQHRLIMEDGRIKWMHEQGNTTFAPDGRPLHTIGVVQDITEQKEVEEELRKRQAEIEHMSFHDHLTGLYNRRYFERELVTLKETGTLPVGMILGDVNGLKLINDSFGHEAGDQLLVLAAGVLGQAAGREDLVCRTGGDEFALIMPGADASKVADAVRRIRELCQQKRIHGIELSLSLGTGVKDSLGMGFGDLLKKAEDQMYSNKLSEAGRIRSNMIDQITRSIYRKCQGEEERARLVSTICGSMARCLKLPPEEIQEYEVFGRLHDIGKIGLTDELLAKPPPLSQEEEEELKRHVEIGHRILSTAEGMSQVAQYVLSHHERWNGQGYPRGLSGKEIPLAARVCAIATTYSALAREEGGRPKILMAKAQAELRQGAGIHYDPALVEIFLTEVLPGLRMESEASI